MTTKNSLHSTQVSDCVGDNNSDVGVVALANGNYVIVSPALGNGDAVNACAVICGNGAKGITGPLSTNNSPYGRVPGDLVGYMAEWHR